MTTSGSNEYDTLSGSAAAEPGSMGGSERTGGDTRERIAARAYELYLQRGGAPGGETDDWLEAERELRGSSQPTGRQSSGE